MHIYILYENFIYAYIHISEFGLSESSRCKTSFCFDNCSYRARPYLERCAPASVLVSQLGTAVRLLSVFILLRTGGQ